MHLAPPWYRVVGGSYRWFRPNIDSLAIITNNLFDDLLLLFSHKKNQRLPIVVEVSGGAISVINPKNSFKSRPFDVS